MPESPINHLGHDRPRVEARYWRTPLTALLALFSAVLIGGADYIGGIASRNASATRVAACSQVVGLILIVPLSLLVGWETLSGSDIGWSLAAGVAVGLGLPLFYAAMTRGLISIVAPVTGMTGAAVPVVFSLARGERPGTLALVGIGVALVAIALVSIVPGETKGAASALPLAVASGILFGLFFVGISLVHDEAGLWPIAFSHVGSAGSLCALALLTTGGLDPGRSVHRLVIAIGSLETIGGVALLKALLLGPVSVAAVLASLYPVTTTLLAAALLRERLNRLQLVAVGLALGAVVLVSLG